MMQEEEAGGEAIVLEGEDVEGEGAGKLYLRLVPMHASWLWSCVGLGGRLLDTKAWDRRCSCSCCVCLIMYDLTCVW